MSVVSSYSFYCVFGSIPGIVWAAHWPAERTVSQLSQWQHEPQHSKTADLGWSWHYHTHHLHPAWRVYRKKRIQTLKLTESNNKLTHKVMCTFNLSMDNLNVTILIDLWLIYSDKALWLHLTRWCDGHPLQIHLHCQGQGSSSCPLMELKKADAALHLRPTQTRRDKCLKKFKWTFCSSDKKITIFFTSSSSSSSSDPLSSLSERGATSYLWRMKIEFCTSLQNMSKFNNFSALFITLTLGSSQARPQAG